MLKGFRGFLLRGNVVDLAVAVIIGTAFARVVASFSKELVTPIFALIGGQPDFSALTFTIGEAEFGYGSFITETIAFVITAAIIYFIVVLPVGKALERFKKDEQAKTSKDQQLLTEIRDLLAARR